MRLLRFTATFASRFSFITIKPESSKIRSLRARNQERWKALNSAECPAGILDAGDVSGFADTTERETQANNITAKPYGPPGPVSLIDTLPSFMALSAAQSALQELPVSEVWMRLAAGYMSHAALEQSLVHGMALMDALKEAFVWRFDPNSAAEEGTDEWAINTMFFGEDGEVDGWSDIKDEHIRAVSHTKRRAFGGRPLILFSDITSKGGLVGNPCRITAGQRVTTGCFRGKSDVFCGRFVGCPSNTIIQAVGVGEDRRPFRGEDKSDKKSIWH